MRDCDIIDEDVKQLVSGLSFNNIALKKINL
jgi:hypothetical protein